MNITGSTEAGCYHQYLNKDPEDWEYWEFHPALGMVFEERAGGVFEMVLVKQPVQGRDFQAIFHTFPGIERYPTSDLYEAHPTNPNLWRYSGRDDDLIVLSNGEKLVPVQMESIMNDHQDVAGASTCPR
jgi:acyl-coenzyme A synthetase/AMP-(fatty) acid ligase